MRVRCRIVLCAIAAGLLVAAVAHGAADLHTDALVAVPALLLLLPLAAGRYVGAERLPPSGPCPPSSPARPAATSAPSGSRASSGRSRARAGATVPAPSPAAGPPCG